MSQMQQQAETVVVNGAVEGVEVKPNGRFVVKVRDPQSTSQYAQSLNTKDPALAQQMMNAVGQSFSFLCGLSHWVNNGQPVTSKWINGVAALQPGAMPVQQPQMQQPQFPAQQQGFPQQQQPAFAPQPAPAPTPAPAASGGWDETTIRRVTWLASLSPAVDALAYLPEDQRTVAALVKMADFFAKTALARGVNGFGDPPAQPQPQPQQDMSQYQGYPEAQGQQPAGDDIPF